MTVKLDRTRQSLTFLRKSWWNVVKEGMKSFGLSIGDAQVWIKWRRKIEGSQLTEVYLEIAVKCCVYVMLMIFSSDCIEMTMK